MKKIISAIDNPKILNKIKKIKSIQIIGKDIPYKEGIIDILKNNNRIDYILIDDKIEGEIKTNTLLKKITEKNKKIKIIIITENKNKIKKNKNIIIYQTKKIKINKLKEIILKEKTESNISTIVNTKKFKEEEINIITNNLKLKDNYFLIKENKYYKNSKFNNNIGFKDIKKLENKEGNIGIIINKKMSNIEKERIFKISNKIIILMENNISGIIKTREIIKNKNINKIFLIIIINKKEIDINIIKNIFREIKEIKDLKSLKNYKRYKKGTIKNKKVKNNIEL